MAIPICCGSIRAIGYIGRTVATNDGGSVTDLNGGNDVAKPWLELIASLKLGGILKKRWALSIRVLLGALNSIVGLLRFLKSNRGKD